MSNVSDNAVTNGASIDADTSSWPLLKQERTWGSLQLTLALATAATATWCYIIGDYVAHYLNFKQSFAALGAGCLIGMLIVAVAAGPISLRFGVDSIATTVPQFGTRGWRIASAIQFVSIVGWNSLLMIFFGKSVSQLLIALNVIDEGAARIVLPATVLLASSMVFLLLLKGTAGIEKLTKIIIGHVFIGAWILYVLVSSRWTDLSMAMPSAASPEKVWNFTTGIEIGIATSFAWWPYLGSMVRMAPNGRTAAAPIMLGMGAPVPLLSMIGVAGSLVLQSSDPAHWMRTVGGPAYGIVALLFVAAANFGTSVAGSYAAAIGLRHYSWFEKSPWPLLVLIAVLPISLVGLSIPELFFAHFGTFMAFIGVTIAPICGIQITDYYLLRKREVSIRAIFDTSPNAQYFYWRGFNPAAILAMAAGFGLYVYLLDPLTYESKWPYQYTTASLPTIVASGAVYWLLTTLFVKHAHKGGYNT